MATVCHPIYAGTWRCPEGFYPNTSACGNLYMVMLLLILNLAQPLIGILDQFHAPNAILLWQNKKLLDFQKASTPKLSPVKSFILVEILGNFVKKYRSRLRI